MSNLTTRESRIKRHARVRMKVTGTAERPRLCVFRSLQHIYAQVIDDTQRHTVAAASTLDPDIKSALQDKDKSACADLVGASVAKRALEKGVKRVIFDRGGYKYHGRIKALADAARKAGLEF
jgi:large subunit ribosomal protein L18